MDDKHGPGMSSGAPPAPRQPAGVLSTWIDEQLRDMQGGQVPRLAALRAKLQSDAFEWDNALLTHKLQLLLEEALLLDFDTLKRRGGMLGLLLGGADSRGGFIAQYRKVLEAAEAVKAQFAELASTYRTHTSGARRVLVELDMEQQSLLREVNQAVEWLADMMDDIAQRGPGADAAKLELLMKRGEFFAGHLKRLHGVQEMAAAIRVVGQNVLERRTALLEQLKLDLEGFEKIWERRVGNLVSEAEKGASALPGWDKAFEAHGELVSRLEATQAACDALQVEEHNMGLHLSALRKELEAVT